MGKAKGNAYLAKRDMTLSGRKVMKGQLVAPAGAPNDYRVFGDNTHWTARWDGFDSLLCDTDGCQDRFDCQANLSRHRLIVHAPERDAREQARLQERADREYHPGDDITPGETTIGGRVVEQIKSGPRGPVPYVRM